MSCNVYCIRTHDIMMTGILVSNSSCLEVCVLKLLTVVRLMQQSESEFYLLTTLLLKTNFIMSSLLLLLKSFFECPRLPPSSKSKTVLV